MFAKWSILIFLIVFQLIKSRNLRQLASFTNYDITFPPCDKNTNCINGTCIANICKCNDKYVTYIDYNAVNENYKDSKETEVEVKLLEVDPKFQMCNYQLKDQLTALMLSIFIGFGSEHFYMLNNSVAAGKLVFYIFCYYLNIVIVGFYVFNKKKRDLLSFIGIFEGIYLGGGFAFMFLWNLYDWIKIGRNQMPDGKGYNLYSWNKKDNNNYGF